MPTINYKLADGTRVPGTTTIIGRFKEAGGLIHWAWQQGRDGLDYRKSRDGAGAIGTLAHSMIEAHIHGLPIPAPVGFSPEDADKAHTGFAAFREWQEDNKFKITHTELNLVSEKYRYGGCPDWLGTINGVPALGDLKTANGSYPEGILQIAAYRNLLTENKILNPEKFVLLRVGKDHADWHVHSWPAAIIDMAWEVFKNHCASYPLMAELKKVAS